MCIYANFKSITTQMDIRASLSKPCNELLQDLGIKQKLLSGRFCSRSLSPQQWMYTVHCSEESTNNATRLLKFVLGYYLLFTTTEVLLINMHSETYNDLVCTLLDSQPISPKTNQANWSTNFLCTHFTDRLVTLNSCPSSEVFLHDRNHSLCHCMETVYWLMHMNSCTDGKVLKIARRHNAMPTSFFISSDEYSSSERGIGKHVVALEFAHESPPFHFYFPPSSSNDNSIDARITPQTTEASLVPHNTQSLAEDPQITDDKKIPAVSFSSSVVSLPHFTTSWGTGGNNICGVMVSPEPDFVSNDDQLCLAVQATDDEKTAMHNTVLQAHNNRIVCTVGVQDEGESDTDSSCTLQQEEYELRSLR
ncbi:uncharacterized protein [Dysidea avara]|uniref:uncharacterized protein n=1 Tax=Dysidea avara TaxID=196820 RepID=UPI00331FB165